MKPDPFSVEEDTFISKSTCPFVRSNEKRNPINISLNVSSLDWSSLSVVKIFPSSNEPFPSGYGFKAGCPGSEPEVLVSLA
jgi:hypothetical protein